MEAQEREAERGRLTEQLITAEQDERRRLSPSSTTGCAGGRDRAHARRSARVDRRTLRGRGEGDREPARVPAAHHSGAATLRSRSSRSLRDGFRGGRRLWPTRSSKRSGMRPTSVAAGERLSEKAQVALYQVIREAINQAVLRRPSQIVVTVEELAHGDYATEVDDDGVDERRRASIEAIEERVRLLNGRLSIESREEGGTAIRVVMPAYVAAAQVRSGPSWPARTSCCLPPDRLRAGRARRRPARSRDPGRPGENGALRGRQGRALPAPAGRPALRVPTTGLRRPRRRSCRRRAPRRARSTSRPWRSRPRPHRQPRARRRHAPAGRRRSRPVSS